MNSLSIFLQAVQVPYLAIAFVIGMIVGIFVILIIKGNKKTVVNTNEVIAVSRKEFEAFSKWQFDQDEENKALSAEADEIAKGFK